MINFENATKIYKTPDKTVKAIENINMKVEEGEICVLLGPSGCGKTTLLRMVNRLIPISSGSIEVNGTNIMSLNTIELRRTIGYVIQQNGLFPNMTIEENINVVPKMLGWDRSKMKKRYNELMEMLGLHPDDFRKRFPFELSGGQQQRIGVARALAADPPVMLMDEPFGALDPVIREHIQNEFLKIQKDVKKTILFVSHDIDEAIKLADKIAIFNTGHLVQYDTPEQILSNPKNEYIQNFVGEDRAIKRLNLFTVKDLTRKIHNFSSRKVSEPPANSINIDMNLRQALSNLLTIKGGESWVVDMNGKKLGVLKLADFEELMNESESGISAV